MSEVYKCFTKVFTNNINVTLHSHRPNEQAGFRSGYSLSHHIDLIHQEVEKYAKHTKSLCTAFIY